MASQYSKRQYSRGTIATLIAIVALCFAPGWTRYGVATQPAPGTSLTPKQAPEFPVSPEVGWLNSGPLRLSEQRGKVVVLNFWTFNCSNCYQSFPWLNHLEEVYGKLGFEVIGIHSPEFDTERDRSLLEAKVAEFGLKHPIFIDNDFAYWKSIGNRAWPSFYIIDRKGEIRAVHSGETHVGDRQATEAERMIQKLIAEGTS